MARYGMLINTKKCIGCFACRIACQNQNHLLDNEAFIRYETKENGEYPTVRMETVPLQCMHCEDAPCVAVCPTGAARFGTDGIVEVDQGRCIGCKYCMAACPYQVRVVNDQTGTVDKCRFCVANTAAGQDASNCVTACPTGVRVFGDLDDPDSEINKEIARTNAQPIAGDLTKSKVFYVR